MSNIKNSTLEDLPAIFDLYEEAIRFQKEKGAVPWAGLTQALVEKEIREKRQWKLEIENTIASVWMTTFSDPQIWGDRNLEPSLYLHRIATKSIFKGDNKVKDIVAWAKLHALEHNKKFVRLDTVGNNKKLIDYYQLCGFDFLGIITLKNIDGLPAHYQNGPVCLFQQELPSSSAIKEVIDLRNRPMYSCS